MYVGYNQNCYFLNFVIWYKVMIFLCVLKQKIGRLDTLDLPGGIVNFQYEQKNTEENQVEYLLFFGFFVKNKYKEFINFHVTDSKYDLWISLSYFLIRIRKEVMPTGKWLSIFVKKKQ